MFRVAISKTIELFMIKGIIDSKISILNKSFGNTIRVYNQAEFQIQRVRVDLGFKTP